MPDFERLRDAIAAEEPENLLTHSVFSVGGQANGPSTHGEAFMPHPSADGAVAARLNIEYQMALKEWQALPWLKRTRTPKPERPIGI